MKKTIKGIENKSIKNAISVLDRAGFRNNDNDLPIDTFNYISRITPMVNVDILIYGRNGVLLSWRDDIHGTGWHIPGGIVRYQETLLYRVRKTFDNEILFSNSECPDIKLPDKPISFTEGVHPGQKIRGHFISFLFDIIVPSDFYINNSGKRPKDKGYLKWFKTCPKNLIKVHHVYIKDILRVLV